MSKYDPLNRFLPQQSTDRITLTFSEIEAIHALENTLKMFDNVYTLY